MINKLLISASYICFIVFISSCSAKKNNNTGSPDNLNENQNQTNNNTTTVATVQGPGEFNSPHVLNQTGSAVIFWNDSDGATSYTIKYGTTTGSYTTTASTSATSPYRLTGLTNGTKYYVMVTATNIEGGITNLNSEVIVTPDKTIESKSTIDFSCAISNLGAVKCWGYNNKGQLGLGDTNNRGDEANEMGNNLPTVNLGTGRTALQISASGSHVCALLDNYTVKCWGKNDYGQLGIEDGNDRGDEANEMGDNLPAINLGTGRTALQIVAGTAFTCALLDNEKVKCWGYNAFGELGLEDTYSWRGSNIGDMGDNLEYVNLGTDATPVELFTSFRTACALFNNNKVKCWGSNDQGDLGIGNTATKGDEAGEMGDNLPYVDLGTGRTITKLAKGGVTCALLDNNDLKCWGYNGYGPLGLEDTNNRGDGIGLMGNSLPAINLGTGRTAIDLSISGNNMCAILDDHTTKCWGINDSGQLGIESALFSIGGNINEMGDNLATLNLGSGRTAVKLCSGSGNSCAILDNNTIKCWGRNDNGQLGLGDTTNRGGNVGDMGDNLDAVDLGTF